MNGLVSGYGTDSEEENDEDETVSKTLAKNSSAKSENIEGKNQ